VIRKSAVFVIRRSGVSVIRKSEVFVIRMTEVFVIGKSEVFVIHMTGVSVICIEEIQVERRLTLGRIQTRKPDRQSEVIGRNTSENFLRKTFRTNYY
jgi:hypothetical protein